MARPLSAATTIATGCLTAVLLVGTASAQPFPLGEAQLDSVTAAGLDTSTSLGAGGRVATQLAVPTSTATAVCEHCTGNASAVASAGAVAVSTDSLGPGDRVSTQVAMPISSAVAICNMCSGNARAIAVANAAGVARTTRSR
jgi:hypothetical protein